MNEFKVYLHGFLILVLAGIGLTLIWTLWPVLVAVVVALVLGGLVWLATQVLKNKP